MRSLSLKSVRPTSFKSFFFKQYLLQGPKNYTPVINPSSFFLDNWHQLLADLECFFNDSVYDPAAFAELLNKQRQIEKFGGGKAILFCCCITQLVFSELHD